jgi:hypothetical protein
VLRDTAKPPAPFRGGRRHVIAHDDFHGPSLPEERRVAVEVTAEDAGQEERLEMRHEA